MQKGTEQTTFSTACNYTFISYDPNTGSINMMRTQTTNQLVRITNMILHLHRRHIQGLLIILEAQRIQILMRYITIILQMLLKTPSYQKIHIMWFQDLRNSCNKYQDDEKTTQHLFMCTIIVIHYKNIRFVTYYYSIQRQISYYFNFEINHLRYMLW